MAWFLPQDETVSTPVRGTDRSTGIELYQAYCVHGDRHPPGAGGWPLGGGTIVAGIVNPQTHAPGLAAAGAVWSGTAQSHVLGAQGAAGPMSCRPHRLWRQWTTEAGFAVVSTWHANQQESRRTIPSIGRGACGRYGDVPPQPMSQQPMNGPAAFATPTCADYRASPDRTAAAIRAQEAGRALPGAFGLALLAVAGLYWYDTFDGSKTSRTSLRQAAGDDAGCRWIRLLMADHHHP